MQKITLFTFLVILFTSCSDVFFTSPQPSFAEDLSEIPEDFQGFFYIDLDVPDSLKGDKPFINITDVTVNEYSIINNDSLVVKSWGNYLFVNLKDSTDKWELLTIRSAPYSANNTIQFMTTSVIDVGRFNNVDTILPTDDYYNGFLYPKYILDEVSTLQFHYLLRITSKSQMDLIKLEAINEEETYDDGAGEKDEE